MLTLLAVVILGALVVFMLFRKPKGEGHVQQTEHATLRTAFEKQEGELREARTRADRYDALAGERKAEIDRLNSDLSKLREKLDCEAEDRQKLSNTISRLQAEMKATQEASEDKIRMLSELRKDMEIKFKDLAAQALALQGEQFSKSNIERLKATLTPLKEHVGHFEQELKAVYKAANADRAALQAEINRLSQRSETISREAINLTRALKSDQQKQGAWGEMILESILERSGLREGVEYETQAHRVNDKGERIRPDVVVNLPGGKTLVIDSKVSLVAYTDAVNAESEEEAKSARKRHVESIKQHIVNLAGKAYQNAEDSTVDYVILFVPIEGALSEALRAEGQITEYAIARNVTIATPTTLMMALKTIANVWAAERRNQNAEAIARRAGLLYDKVAGFVDNMQDLGKRLNQAQSAYQDAFGQLSQGRGNMLSQVEHLKMLGAKTVKSISADFENEEAETVRIEAQNTGE